MSSVANSIDFGYTGDFIDPKAANELFIAHLRKLLRYYQANPVKGPYDLGFAALTLKKVVCKSPCLPVESVEEAAFTPLLMFADAILGDLIEEGDGVISAFGIDTAEIIELEKLEHEVRMGRVS